MEDLIIDGQTFEFTVVTGDILSQNKFSETHVSGGGGGGTHGHSSNISISSQAITKQEFWIKTDDGKEKSIQLSGFDIPLREGQRISIVNMWDKEKEVYWHVCLVNHTADDYFILGENGPMISVKKWVWSGLFIYMPIGGVLGGVYREFFVYTNDPTVILGALSGAGLCLFLRGVGVADRKAKVFRKKALPHIRKIAKELLAQGK